MQKTIKLKTIVAHPYFSLASVLAVFFLLPRFGGIAVMAACAGILTACVLALPERFRSRRGSMRLALSLVMVMWLAPAVVSIVALAGELRN